MGVRLEKAAMEDLVCCTTCNAAFGFIVYLFHLICWSILSIYVFDFEKRKLTVNVYEVPILQPTTLEHSRDTQRTRTPTHACC